MSNGEEEKPPVCAKCATPETDTENPTLRPCITCKSVSYCSRECKKADTKAHKKVCAAAAQEYMKTADVKMASRAPPKAETYEKGLRKWQFDTPRLRPTLSRRNKYLTIAPRAGEKLYRESRRGSHDLRRLVGHANFLDVLVESLDDPGDGGEDILEPVLSPSDSGERTETSAEELSDGSSTASEDAEWSDDSDDDDHSLVRTASRNSLLDTARAARAETEAAIAQTGDDYFSRPEHAEAVIRVGDVAAVGEADDKNAGVTVSDMEVTSSLSDIMEELGYDRSSSALLSSPACPKEPRTSRA